MSNAVTNLRCGDDSDVYVTFDPRTRILDVPDDGRVAELLPGRTNAPRLRASTSTGFDRRDRNATAASAMTVRMVKAARNAD